MPCEGRPLRAVHPR